MRPHESKNIFLGILLSIVFLLVSNTSIYAQTADHRKEFRCAIFEKIPDQQIYYRNSEEFIPIKFIRGRRSSTYELNGEHGLELYDKVKDKDGNLVYNLLGKSSYKPEITKALFLIDKVIQPTATKTSLPWRVLTLKDDLIDFPRGSFRFINLTNTDLGVIFNSINKRVKTMSAVTIAAKEYKKGGFTPLVIYGPDKTALFSSRVFGQPLGREIILIYPSKTKGKKVTLNFLYETVPLPDEESEESN